MTYARQLQVSIKDTPYYHCVARCVRRAWLWGVDEYAGKDYSHRKQWIINRLEELSYVFAIDTCAYAVMSNHYHLVLFIDLAKALGWTDDEVIRRWTKLHRLPQLIRSDSQDTHKSQVANLIQRVAFLALTAGKH